ncbi:MAG TPA: hypothetical protein IAC99_01795 [Candidatus Choladocola avistercoris]|nr:hypothetical protein [Candidatus Choladocola avistercoris]
MCRMRPATTTAGITTGNMPAGTMDAKSTAAINGGCALPSFDIIIA